MMKTLEHFITKIESLQSKGCQHFPDGIFPAYRTNSLIGYKRRDTTMFFSSVIAFTLRSVKERLPQTLWVKIDSICAMVINNYPDFQNKDGLKTYNFWTTKPSGHFPNGFLFRHFDHFRIPDDIDDTAFAYLTTDPLPEELLWLKNKLAIHANGTTRQIRNTFSEYRLLRAYSTWFGKNMYVEFDVSVLSNMLYCIFYYDLPLNQHDEDSLKYIHSVIVTNRYLDAPFRCAHQYPRSSLIIYHVARLIAAFNPAPLAGIRSKLVSDTKALLMNSQNQMDRVILSTSLMRLGERTERISVENFTAEDFKGFYFFIAGLLTAYETKLLYRLSDHPLFHMHWVCEAHCWTLLLEYETLWSDANVK